MAIRSCSLPQRRNWCVNSLPEGVTLRELGEHRLKGLLNSERLLQVVASDLRSDFPPLASLTGHSLPAERDAFVGRREPLAELARRLGAGARLVSVLGIGGTGKTRLVTRFGWSSLGDFPGGVWFCDLSQARSLDGIVHAVAQGLDVPLGKDDPVTQIGHAIAGRGTVSGDPRQLRASRTPRGGNAGPLAQPCERRAVPRDHARSAGTAGRRGPRACAARAVRCGCAVSCAGQRRRSRDFQPNAEDQSAIAPLVKLLEGLPLAIELAAARVRVMPPRTLLLRMSERFKLLVVDRRARWTDRRRCVQCSTGRGTCCRYRRKPRWPNCRCSREDSRSSRWRRSSTCPRYDERAVADRRAAIAGAEIACQTGGRRSIRSPGERARSMRRSTCAPRHGTRAAVRRRCSRRKFDTARTLQVWTRRRPSQMLARKSTISSWLVAGRPREATPIRRRRAGGRLGSASVARAIQGWDRGRISGARHPRAQGSGSRQGGLVAGEALGASGKDAEACAQFEAALARAREVGDRRCECRALIGLSFRDKPCGRSGSCPRPCRGRARSRARIERSDSGE